MAKQTKPYRVLTSNSLDGLEKKMAKWMAKGFVPTDGFKIDRFEFTDGRAGAPKRVGRRYVQPIARTACQMEML